MPGPNWGSIVKKSMFNLFLTTASSALAVTQLFADETDQSQQNTLYAFEAALYGVGLCYELYKNLNHIEDAATAYLFAKLDPITQEAPAVFKGASRSSLGMFILGVGSEIAMAVIRYAYEREKVASVIGVIAPLITGSGNLVIETGYDTLASDALAKANAEGVGGVELDKITHLRREFFGIGCKQNRWFRFAWMTTLNKQEIDERCQDAHCEKDAARNPVLYQAARYK